jgi:hypothetical protein
VCSFVSRGLVFRAFCLCFSDQYVKIAKGIVALSLFQRDIHIFHHICIIFKVNLPQKAKGRDVLDFYSVFFRNIHQISSNILVKWAKSLQVVPNYCK